MNLSPRPPTVNDSLVNHQEFAAIIKKKSANFIGRDFVFIAIDNFMHRYNRGYFTIIGSPGSGKSAIIAEYFNQKNPLKNAQVIYYNAEQNGKNQIEEFLRFVCQQLLDMTPPQPSPQAGREENRGVIPDNATEGSWFLSLLLQKISENLLQPNQLNQKLIIAIDGLNYVNQNLQPPGTNILYLPRYLPHGVYFLLTRRPFLTSNSGLLIEAPMESLNLADYPEENKQDIQNYIRRYLNDENSILKSWLNSQEIQEEEFVADLTNRSENNFLDVSEILSAINNGFYNQISDLETCLPPELEIYYQQHLQQILESGYENFSLAVLRVLVMQTQPISVGGIGKILDVDEYEIEELLEGWIEFLKTEWMIEDKVYCFYNSRFCNFIKGLIVQREDKLG